MFNKLIKFFSKKKKKENKKEAKKTLSAGMISRTFWTNELNSSNTQTNWYEIKSGYAPLQVFIPKKYDNDTKTTSLSGSILVKVANCNLNNEGEPSNPDSIGYFVKNSPDLMERWEFTADHIGLKGIFIPIHTDCLISFELEGTGNVKLEISG